MFSDIISSASYNLRGNRIKSLVTALAPCASFLLFALSAISSFYLLIVDTTFFASIGIFSNSALHALVCGILILENTVLFFLFIYSRLYVKNYFIFYSIESIKISDIIKSSLLYFCITVFKAVLFSIFFAPFALSTFLILKIAERGVAFSAFIVIIIFDLLLLFAGIIFYRMYSFKVYLADVFFYTDKNKSIITSLRKSAQKMNGKCRRLVLFELRYLYMKILSLLMLPALYYLPLYNAMRAFSVTEKEIPYAIKRQHTEKSIVFYF